MPKQAHAPHVLFKLRVESIQQKKKRKKNLVVPSPSTRRQQKEQPLPLSRDHTFSRTHTLSHIFLLSVVRYSWSLHEQEESLWDMDRCVPC
ncbi:hypothetical protein HanPSC8_Chr16g0711791 [Helianthus annuus]|nr:hypothetical protein HanPSC8_Chr16g0711791 [Helianthus annuus]